MNAKKIMMWIPRVLAILFAVFISIFALDSFEFGFPQVIVALFMHLIPTYVLVGLTTVSWKKPFYGGIGFIMLAIAFTFFFDTYEGFINFMLISFPVLVVGVLFVMQKFKRFRT